MKTFFALLAGGLAVMTANPAFAQADDEQEIIPQTPAGHFTGATLEATIGGNYQNDKSFKDIGAAEVRSSSGGLTYGGALGYDFSITDHLTLGVQFAVYGHTNKLNNTTNLVPGVFNLETVRIGRDIFVGPRIGYALSDKSLVFIKLGYANTRFGISGTDSEEILYDGINAKGARLGAGLEHKLTKLTYVKLEYDYSHYATGQYAYNNETPDGSIFDLHSDQHQVLASFGIRF